MLAGPGVQYDRKIRYLDYYENGQRCQGAGFIKLERRDELCNISLQVSGLYRKDRFTRPFLLIGEQEEKELCKLQIADGGVKMYFEGLDCRNLGGQGVRYDSLLGVKIPVAEGKEIRCIWRRLRDMEDTSENTERENEETAAAVSQKEDKADVQAEKGKKRNQSRSTGFKEEKWEQLWMIYPHVRPFMDDREFLSVGPGDFVLLNRQSYKLVNNSFLLHGYYSYHHLILMRGRNRGQTNYYIGVPGNLYERDRKSAILFGFESFECAKEPAAEGDFGYYLIPVEL